MSHLMSCLYSKALQSLVSPSIQDFQIKAILLDIFDTLSAYLLTIGYNYRNRLNESFGQRLSRYLIV